MPTCQHCLHKWTWKQNIKKSFKMGVGMKCPYCHEMQYYSARFRKNSSMVSFIVPLLLAYTILICPSYLFLIALLAFLPLYTIIVPFFVELTNEEEPLF